MNLKLKKELSPIKNLEAEREKLIDSFLKNRSSDFLYKHCKLIDDYFKSAFEIAGGNKKIKPDIKKYAIAALGGYGRKEQAICSDIDIMILFEGRLPKSSQNFISEVVYPLWDLKFELGYSFKNVKEGIKIEKEHFETFTALLDLRFIIGNRSLYLKLADKLKKKIESSASQTITDWLIETNKERHKKFGDSSYLLEPNLKEGKGGLRDYHTILWIARIKFGLSEFKDLERIGIFSHEEFNRLKKIGLNVNEISGALALNKEDWLKRRLQSIVADKQYAKTLKSARQLIVHKHISIDGNVVNIPGYIVPVEQESSINITDCLFKNEPR